jgi:hypothetical protein
VDPQLTVSFTYAGSRSLQLQPADSCRLAGPYLYLDSSIDPFLYYDSATKHWRQREDNATVDWVRIVRADPDPDDEKLVELACDGSVVASRAHYAPLALLRPRRSLMLQAATETFDLSSGETVYHTFAVLLPGVDLWEPAMDVWPEAKRQHGELVFRTPAGARLSPLAPVSPQSYVRHRLSPLAERLEVGV